jgi:hypothetical protein
MTDLHLHITEAGGPSRVVHIPINPEETWEAFADRITEGADVDGHAILEIALDTPVPGDTSRRLRDMPLRHQELTLHRTCVEVHFETESERHWFPVQARWANVHRWACKKFEVAADACANLELREDKADGPPINERDPIGKSDKCKVVWVVKPGPESNG